MRAREGEDREVKECDRDRERESGEGRRGEVGGERGEIEERMGEERRREERRGEGRRGEEKRGER